MQGCCGILSSLCGNCTNSRFRSINPCSCCIGLPGTRANGARKDCQIKCCLCDFNTFDGEGTMCTFISFIISIVLLFPYFLLYIIILPFWLISQYISSKLDIKRNYIITLIIFIIFTIPAFILWIILWNNICNINTNNNELGIQIFCIL